MKRKQIFERKMKYLKEFESSVAVMYFVAPPGINLNLKTE